MAPASTPADGGRSRHFAQELFSPLPDRYERLAAVLSFGQNGRWRREMVRHTVEGEPAIILDVATGPGGVALELARGSTAMVVGADVTASMLRAARDNARHAGLAERVTLAQCSAERLPFPDDTFDALSFTYLLRYVPHPHEVLHELVRVLKPGGTLANLEFFVPPARLWRASWWLYTRLLLPMGGLLLGGREWYEVGRFLGPSISSHYRRYPLGWHLDAWSEAGIIGIEASVMSRGGGVVMWGRKEHA